MRHFHVFEIKYLVAVKIASETKKHYRIRSQLHMHGSQKIRNGREEIKKEYKLCTRDRPPIRAH